MYFFPQGLATSFSWGCSQKIRFKPFKHIFTDSPSVEQWFSTGAIWPPRRSCRISEGPQVKVVKLGAMETVK
jgi:hypothetical protein